MGLSSSSSSRHSIAAELQRVAAAIFVLLASMWIAEAADQWILHGALDRWAGIRPRTGEGTLGIALHPFAHGDFNHLLSNTIGLAILGALVAGYGIAEFWRVTALSIFVAGLGVWLVAPASSITVGASGLVFGYFGYTIARGWYERRIVSIALSLFVAVTQGAIVFGMVPGLVAPHVSWQAHLFGCVGGILAARRFRSRPRRARAPG